jgi:membrane protease YdiL (CAAX protease family)
MKSLKTAASFSLALFLTFGFSARGYDGPVFSVDPRYAPERPRNYWLPLASFVLPGLGQYIEQQWEPGFIYTGTAAFGLSLASVAAKRIEKNKLGELDYDEYNGLQRQYTYGMQLYMFSGEMSAFHSFRTAVKTRKPGGEFAFLKAEEDPSDLLTAPFEFSMLARPTTYIPMIVGLGLALATYDPTPHADFDGGDAAFAGGVSYNAGVGEEAFFRGYLMPVLREKWGSDFWSNATTATVFGAAHYSERNKFPVAQALMGYYLGWVSQRNGWSLKESIFIHAWWDVIALGEEVASNKTEKTYRFPGIYFTF